MIPQQYLVYNASIIISYMILQQYFTMILHNILKKNSIEKKRNAFVSVQKQARLI